MDIRYLLGSVPSNSNFDHPKRVVGVCFFVVVIVCLFVEHFQVNHTDSSNVNLKGCRLSSAIVVNSAQPRNRDHQTSFKLLTPLKICIYIILLYWSAHCTLPKDVIICRHIAILCGLWSLPETLGSARCIEPGPCRFGLADLWYGHHGVLRHPPYSVSLSEISWSGG